MKPTAGSGDRAGFVWQRRFTNGWRDIAYRHGLPGRASSDAAENPAEPWLSRYLRWLLFQSGHRGGNQLETMKGKARVGVEEGDGG